MSRRPKLRILLIGSSKRSSVDGFRNSSRRPKLRILLIERSKLKRPKLRNKRDLASKKRGLERGKRGLDLVSVVARTRQRIGTPACLASSAESVGKAGVAKMMVTIAKMMVTTFVLLVKIAMAQHTLSA